MGLGWSGRERKIVLEIQAGVVPVERVVYCTLGDVGVTIVAVKSGEVDVVAAREKLRGQSVGVDARAHWRYR